MPQQNTVFLKNEQPVEGCTDCQIFWYVLVNARNQWRMRPTENRLQRQFEASQDNFLRHYKEAHQTKKVVFASYGDPEETLNGKMLTRETAETYARSLIGHTLSDFTGNGLETIQSKIIDAYVVADSLNGDRGYVWVTYAAK